MLMVRRWQGPDCSVRSFRANTLSDLKEALKPEFGTPKLYYFKDSVFKSMKDRIAISDEESFQHYLACKVPRPHVLAFYESSAEPSCPSASRRSRRK